MSTIYDVAKKAGVSPATVSRVLNGTAPISTATRERVMSAVREMDYRANSAASALASKKTLMIGLILPDIQNPYSATLARGVQDMTSSQGYFSVICNTDGDAGKEIQVLKEIYRHGVDGLVITPSLSRDPSLPNAYIRELHKKEFPIVLIGNRLNDPSADYVTSRAQDGAAQAAHYLHSLGHRQIGFIGGYYTRGIAVGRWLGYQEALLSHGLPLRSEWMVETEVSQAGGEAAMNCLLDLEHRPTAVLAVNDLMALGAVVACQRRGICVPGEMSVIGFDDIPFAAQATPPLTTVAQPAYDLGYRAADLLLRRCHNPSLPPQQAILHCQLVIRQTTAPPPEFEFR